MTTLRRSLRGWILFLTLVVAVCAQTGGTQTGAEDFKKGQTAETAKKYAESRTWYEKAAGDPEAKFRLGGMLLQGRDLPQDQARGIALMNTAADQGAVLAQYEVGRALMGGGPGVPADPHTALRWYRQARQLGLCQVAPAVQRLEQATGANQKR